MSQKFAMGRTPHSMLDDDATSRRGQLRYRRRALIATMLTLAAPVSILANDTISEARPAGGTSSDFAFERLHDDGNREIYLQSGSAPPRNLTLHPAQDSDPSWGDPPDCGLVAPGEPEPVRPQRLAFQRDRNGNNDILVIDFKAPAPDSEAGLLDEPLPARNVTNTDGLNETAPAWSPGPANRFEPSGPNRIAYTVDRGGNRDIYLMNLDDPPGTLPKNLTDSPEADDANPDWSPDGQYIAFDSNRAGGKRQIWILDVAAAMNGPELPTPATRGDLPESNPSWMTYGSRLSPLRTEALLYRVLYEGASYLDLAVDDRPVGDRPFVPATADSQPLTGEPGGDSAPSWDPHGDGLSYRSDRIGASGISRIRSDPQSDVFTEASLLDTGSQTDTNPEWRSRGANCAGFSPTPPRPGPVKRPPRRGGSGDDSTGSSGTPVPPFHGVSVTAPALTVRNVSVKAVGRGARRRVIVRLTVNRRARTTLRLKRRGRSVTRRAYQIRSGVNRLTLKVPRRARKGLHRLTITVRADRTRTIVRRVRLQK